LPATLRPRSLRRLTVVDLNPVGTPSSTTPFQPELVALDDHDWAEARRRLELIGPLLDRARCPRAVIVERARSAGLDPSTLYRWARAYRASGLLSSLLPYKPSGGRGKSRLQPAVEQIVTDAIAEHFLTRQQRAARSTSLEAARRCHEAKLPAPNPNTVRLRIAAIPNRERLARRSHRKAARDRYAPHPGVFDSARQPLDLIQIDHTKLAARELRGRLRDRAAVETRGAGVGAIDFEPVGGDDRRDLGAPDASGVRRH
jgi:putative transposase